MKLALPPWLAVMLHVPDFNKVRLVPLMVQTALLPVAKLTASPELALATSGSAVGLTWAVVVTLKLMVCVALATLKVRVTGLAGPKSVLPVWVASMLQGPPPSMVSVAPLLPVVVHTVGVLLVKITGKPELAVADKINGVAP